MRNIVLIASYKRPECITANALKKAGYEGELMIVADDTDDTEYEKLYPGHVLRFSKSEYAGKVDTADNFGIMCSAVYAYNFCWDYAKENAYDTYCLFDDDVSGFSYRYFVNGKLKSKKIRNMQGVLEAYAKFVHTSGILCASFMSAGRLFGGAKSKEARTGVYYNPTNIFVINTSVEPLGEYPFIGTYWLDATFNYLNNQVGRLSAAFMPITMQMQTPGTGKGGYEEVYKTIPKSKGTDFIGESYGNMIIPSFFRWNAGCIGGKFSQDVPRVLSDKWRKDDAR